MMLFSLLLAYIKSHPFKGGLTLCIYQPDKEYKDLNVPDEPHPGVGELTAVVDGTIVEVHAPSEVGIEL